MTGRARSGNAVPASAGPGAPVILNFSAIGPGRLHYGTCFSVSGGRKAPFTSIGETVIMIKQTLVAVALALPLMAFAADTTKPVAAGTVTPSATNPAQHKYPHKGARAQCQAAAKQQYPNPKDVAKYKAAVAACERN